ncbi:hypothetical protein BSPWISOXPB_5936 [uncultured Gammaproteobacteria bacterium]|nr:hypothetical protein BSPWISOXPB_5936 [uncultured Gammaproteobacteria bacterium]
MSDTKKVVPIKRKQIKIYQNGRCFYSGSKSVCVKLRIPDHQLVNAALLYASARFSGIITASLSKSKKTITKVAKRRLNSTQRI